MSLLEKAWQPSPGEWCHSTEPGPELLWNTALQRMMHLWVIPVLEQPRWGHASHRMLKGATLGATSLEVLTQRRSRSALIFAPSKIQAYTFINAD